MRLRIVWTLSFVFLIFARLIASAENAPLKQAPKQLKLDEYDSMQQLEDNYMKIYGNNETLPAEISIDEEKVINHPSKMLLGFNHSWHLGQSIELKSNASTELDEEFTGICKEFPVPFIRIGGTGSQTYRWKLSIGPLSKRASMKLYAQDSEKQIYGLLEWVKSFQKINPDVQFCWTFNMYQEHPEDAVDLIDFLTGAPDKAPEKGLWEKNIDIFSSDSKKENVNWAKLRVDYGVKKPVPVAVWELGQEMDWIPAYWTKEEYVRECKRWIRAIKPAHPEVKLAIHANGGPWGPYGADKRYNSFNEWRTWLQFCLKELGGDVDYVVWHMYYDGTPLAMCFGIFQRTIIDDIKAAGYDNLKLFISEHSMYPKRMSVQGSKFEISPFAGKKDINESHSLKGVLSTADFYLRTLQEPMIEMANYHSFSAYSNRGPWKVVAKDAKSSKLYLSGIADLFILLNNAYCNEVVETKVEGKYTDLNAALLPDYLRSIATNMHDAPPANFIACAMREGNKLNILIDNKSPITERHVRFKFKKNRYRLIKEHILTAKNYLDYNTASNKKISNTVKNYDSKDAFSDISIPAKSVVLLELEKLGEN
ncbi:MAG: hypothetical protein A2020_12965 [Lentisphaerae bacterium GWF2_45_14]|nr:MAG: hypothetical protein A2020_12965 [Lentisphaerae bacterium GWF2_45_14]